jgi:hypothetical protein
VLLVKKDLGPATIVQVLAQVAIVVVEDLVKVIPLPEERDITLTTESIRSTMTI